MKAIEQAKHVLDLIAKRLKSVRREFWINFLIACVAAFALEQAADWIVEGDHAGAQSVFDASGIYQQLVTTGPRKPISHYTAVVEIDPKKDSLSISHNNLCKQRALVAVLLNALASANPAVVVIDRYFDPTECNKDPDDQARTGELKDALENIAKKVPVVVTDHAPSHAKDGDSDPNAKPLFLPSAGSMFYLGISNLDVDSRRLPLRWILPPEDAAVASRTDAGSTMALQAARQFDPHILAKNARMNDLVNVGENPYLSFLTADQFLHFYAGEVLCLSPDRPQTLACEAWSNRPPGSLTFRDLAHKIVIIGERDAQGQADNRHSVIGEVPGFYLWANYIEAALDDRVFRQVHPLINYAIGFFIFAAFEFILESNKDRLFRAIGMIVFLFASSIVILYLAVVHTGYYMNPATVGLLAIAINLGHMGFARVEKAEKAEKEEAHQP